jgi:hypothetical protein
MLLGDQESDVLNTMTWDEFCDRFRTLATAGTPINTTLAQHQAMAKLRWSAKHPRPVADVLREMERIRSSVSSKIDDSTMIHNVINAIHPELRPRVSYTTAGKDYSTYSEFRTNLLAQAAVLEPQLLSQPPAGASGAAKNGNNGNKQGRHFNQKSGGFKPKAPHHNFKPNGKGNKPQHRDLSQVTCHKCKGKGHLANQCPSTFGAQQVCVGATLADESAHAALQPADVTCQPVATGLENVTVEKPDEQLQHECLRARLARLLDMTVEELDNRHRASELRSAEELNAVLLAPVLLDTSTVTANAAVCTANKMSKPCAVRNGKAVRKANTSVPAVAAGLTASFLKKP